MKKQPQTSGMLPQNTIPKKKNSSFQEFLFSCLSAAFLTLAFPKTDFWILRQERGGGEQAGEEQQGKAFHGHLNV